MDKLTDLPNCTHYDLALQVLLEPVHPAYKLYGGTIAVECQTRIENRTAQAVERVPFLLYRLLDVQEVRDGSGNALPFRQTVTALPELPRLQVNAVEVSLPKPLPSGATAEVCLRYSGPVCGYTEVYPYVHDHVSEAYTLLRREVLWFPVVGRSFEEAWRDAFTFDASITAPSGAPAPEGAPRDPGAPLGAAPEGTLTVLTNGQPGETEAATGSRTTHWHLTVPARRLTVICAPLRQAAISADVALYYLAEDEVGAGIVARAMRRTRELCTDWFGPLPADRLSADSLSARSLRIVEIPGGWGSEAEPTLILQTSGAFRAEGPDDPDAYRRALSQAGHELIHLWNAPSAEEHVSRFLDEGITQYLEALLLRTEVSEEAYWKRLDDYRRYFVSSGEAASIPLAEAGRHGQVREALSRGKGPWLVCVLHHLLGERFLPALRAFFDRYRETGATLQDFCATMEGSADASTGLDLGPFFDDWVWGAASSAYLAEETSGPELVRRLVGRY